MRSTRFALIAALPILCLVPPVAWAADEEPEQEQLFFYLEYQLGVGFHGQEDVEGAGATGAGLSGEADLAMGYSAGGALGVRFLEHFRSELAINWNEAEVDNLQVQGESGTAKGGYSLLAVMANGYVDFDFSLGVVPYLGAGIGWGQIEFDARNAPTALQAELDDTDSVFVWNLMAGANVPLTDVVSFSLGYRYLATEEPRFHGRAAGSPQRFETEFDAHQLVMGMRIGF